MALIKSSRFSKFSGEFGEALFLYWLGKNGFEPTFIDHSGIDLLAYHAKSNKRFGISIKTRFRKLGTGNVSTNLKNSEIPKIKRACRDFAALPYVGVVVDRVVDKQKRIDCFLISLKDLLKINKRGKSVVSIGVTNKYWQQYESKKCLRLHFTYTEDGSITA